MLTQGLPQGTIQLQNNQVRVTARQTAHAHRGCIFTANETLDICLDYGTMLQHWITAVAKKQNTFSDILSIHFIFSVFIKYKKYR